MKAHRKGINEAFLVRHTLKITGLNQDNADKIQGDLIQMDGVDQVAVRQEDGVLSASYDASYLGIDEIIGVVRGNGAEIKENWWARMKIGWARQTDRNLQDNAHHHPHCCNKTPS